VSRLCEAADVSRSGYYRFLKPAVDRNEEMELRDEIQKIAIKNPAYGYRRITAELGRRKRVVNRKRVLRIMREDNLLCLRRRSFVRTTNSDHKLPVYPNLAKELKVNGLNQLWIADITYIRLVNEFVYLAVILDSFSRRVIGWALGRTLESDLAVDAIEDGNKSWPCRSWAGSPFRSRISVCISGLYGSARGSGYWNQHEPAGQPVGQRPGRIIYEDLEIRGGLSLRVSRHR
jgi:transposase InsO family protein